MQKNGSPGWTHLPIFPVVLSWILVINSCLGKINKQDKYWVASSILQAEFERHGRPDKYMAVARSWFPITAGWSEVATAALIPASAPTYCHRENMTEKGCACFSAIAIHSLHTDVRVPRRDWLIQNTCSSCSRKLHFRSSGFSFYLSFLIFRYLGHSLFPPHPTDYGFLKTLTISGCIQDTYQDLLRYLSVQEVCGHRICLAQCCVLFQREADFVGCICVGLHLRLKYKHI